MGESNNNIVASFEKNLVQTITHNEYIINIDYDIEPSYFYREAFLILRNAKSDDTIRLVINSYGGYLEPALQFYNLLLNTQAKTIAEIYAAYSSASIIALSCDNIITKDFCSMLIHSLSTGSDGKALFSSLICSL